MINLYDFDGTIYDGDSTVDFFFFCLKKKPYIIIYLPLFFIYGILYWLDVVSKDKMKEKFFMFLNCFSNIDNILEDFWEINFKKIKSFYLNKSHEKDVIISASPYFLLKPICNKLNVKKLIASPVNKYTGKYEGKNCDGAEKVKMLKKEFKHFDVNEAYSDSYKDTPIWKLSKNAYLVKKNNIIKLNIKELREGKSKNSKYKLLINFLLIISLDFLCLLMVGKYDLKYIKYLIILNTLFSVFIVRKINDCIFIDFDTNSFLVSLLFSLYSVGLLKDYSQSGIVFFRNILNNYFKIFISFDLCLTIVCVIALFSFVMINYYLIKKIFPFVVKEFYDLDKLDRYFFIFTVIVGFILTSLIYNKTNAFYTPFFNRKVFINYDVLFTSDSGILCSTNAYMNIGASENDLRQPLFAFFAMPFTVISMFISKFFRFIPNSYYVVFTTNQILMLAICVVLVCKMLNLKHSKLVFYILHFCSYTMLVFPFVYEQYIIALFYLILAIYIGYYRKCEINYLYCGAVGTLLTSGIIFSGISRFKNIKYWIKNIFKCFILFMILMILSGQILMLCNIVERFNFLIKFSGNNLSFYSKLVQFLYFVRSLFIRPLTNVTFSDVPRYWLVSVNSISFIGISILLLCFISFIINRKNKFAWISMLWILFSFFILCIFGWGTQENGLILYSLYFYWAYCSLLILLIDKVKNNLFRNFIFLTVVVIMLCINIPGLIDIVKFGIKYYPALYT